MTVGIVFSQPYARSLLGPTFASRTDVQGPKSFAQHVLGIITQFGEPCLWLTESTESSPVGEVEIKIKMDDGVVTSLASEGVDLSIC